MTTKSWRHEVAHRGRAVRLSFVFILVVPLLFLAAPAGAGDTGNGLTAFRDKLYDVRYVSPQEAWVVGFPGMLLHSTDAGSSWEKVEVPTSEALFAMDFVDRNHGWIVGRNGTILTTADGGKTWSLQTSNTTEPLFSVDFIDASKGWAVGNFGTIVHTADGGRTWTAEVLEAMTSAGIHSVFFHDAYHGWLVGEYPIWEAQLEEDVESSSISNMFRTDDGGKTWQCVMTGIPYTLYDVAFSGDGTGWAVGSKGILIASEDGGATWKQIPTDKQSHLLRIALQKDNVWIVGAGGTLMVVDNHTPRAIALPIYTWFSSVSFGDASHGLLVGGRGTLMVTNDGGKTWK